MTDATGADVAPLGTKRRGSIEDVAAPDLPSDDTKAEPPKHEPDEILSLNDTFQANGRRSSLKHRRRNTDSGLSYNANKKFGSASSTAVIKLMSSELPPSQRSNMLKKANDLKLERELKHAQIKLQETQDQCNTAVEIIGNLQKENEDLLSLNDTLRTELGAAQTEIQILDQRAKSLEGFYRSDAQKLEAQLEEKTKEIDDLNENIQQKDISLNQAKEYQKTMQMQKGLDDDEVNANNGDLQIKLGKELVALKKKIQDRDGKIESLLSQLELTTQIKQENETLQNEIESLNDLAQQDLMVQKLQIEKMTSEVILLSSRNSALAQDKEDLIALVEERDFENQMLKTGYGLHREKTHANLGGIADQLADEFEDDEELETLDQYHAWNDHDSLSGSPHKPEKKVADVTREYLHLTASVVNMKFPRIQYSSEELINKVKNYQFWEYHDMMVRIMKTEEQKMLAKQKIKDKQKHNATGSGTTSNTLGVLGRFRNFFGNKDNKTNKDNKRTSMFSPKTEPMATQDTRLRNKSATVQKRAPSPPLSIDDAKKKVKELKESAKKKITGTPSDQDTQKMADMSFKSVPFVGKAKKPDQGL